MTDPTDEQDWETVAMWVDQSAQDAFSHLRSKYEELEKANEGWPAVIEDAHKRLSDKVTEVKQLQGEVELWKSRTRLAEQGESSLGDEVERLRAQITKFVWVYGTMGYFDAPEGTSG